MLEEFTLYNFLYTRLAIIILRGDKMGIETRVRKHVYEKYEDNILVKQGLIRK